MTCNSVFAWTAAGFITGEPQTARAVLVNYATADRCNQGKAKESAVTTARIDPRRVGSESIWFISFQGKEIN